MSGTFPSLSSIMLNEFGTEAVGWDWIGTGSGTWQCPTVIFVATLEMERTGTETGWSGAGKFGNTVWTGGSEFGTVTLGGNVSIDVVRTSDNLLIAERVASLILEKVTAGAGLRIAWVNSLIALMAFYSEERKGMSQWRGKNWTVSAMRLWEVLLA